MALVIDLGSYETRAGFAHDISPTFVERSCALSLKGSGDGAVSLPVFGDSVMDVQFCESSFGGPTEPLLTTPLWTLEALTAKRDVRQDSLLYSHIMHVLDRVGVLPRGSGVGVKEHVDTECGALSYHPLNLIVPEAWFDTPEVISRCCSIILESSYGTSAIARGNMSGVYFSRPSVSAVIGSGKPSGLILDVGYSQSTASAVVDGCVLKRTVQTRQRGGRDVTLGMCEAIEKAGLKNSVSSLLFGNGFFEKSTGTRTDFLFQQFVNNVKMFGGGFVSVPQLNVKEEEVFRAGNAAEAADAPVIAPDGTPFTFEKNVLSDPFECLFEKSGVNVAEMLVTAKMLTPAEIGAGLPLILCGGSIQAPHFTDRILHEMQLRDHSAAMTKALKLPSPLSSPLDLSLLQWHGAALVASSSAFETLWITPKDYAEYGGNIVRRKLLL